VPDFTTAVVNLGRKAGVRLLAVHKPVVRLVRRRARAAQQRAMVDAARSVEREIGRTVSGRGHIVVGPWLGEVGYEALYWLPFLRWILDRYRVDPERLMVVSRGGVEHWYDGLAARYVDLFDLLSPDELAMRNELRQQRDEDGGRKQFRRGELDDWLLRRAGADAATVLHPSCLFRLFRDVWQGNLPLDFLFTHADFARLPKPPRPSLPSLPSEYVAVKFYSGVATPERAEIRETLRNLVREVAARTPVVVLDTGLSVDDHCDFVFDDIPGVESARRWMTARTNLGLQSAIVAHARYFLGTCGGLAWLAPFMGVPTVAAYMDDALLRPHLTIARQAGTQVGAAEFATLDIRALRRIEGDVSVR
jgi:hypothetical protein